MSARNCRLVSLLACSSDVKAVRWHLHNCDLRDNRTALLADGLQSAGKVVNLQLVALSQNLIGDLGMFALSRAVASGVLDRLQVITLSNNRIGYEGLMAFCKAFAGRSHALLTKLELSFNHIGDGGLIALVDSLGCKSFSSLVHLGLSANRINDLGITALAASLTTNSVLTNLQVLGLSRNGFSDDGVTELCKAFQKGACGDLQKLYMSANQIGDCGMRMVSKMLNLNSSLKFLYVAQNTSAEHVKLEISATCAARNIHLSI
jgi:Ran GTPase-activating protein (RanGAP) involved in mRNA processing and transport